MIIYSYIYTTKVINLKPIIMHTSLALELARKELIKAQQRVDFLEAEMFLVELYESATYSNIGLSKLLKIDFKQSLFPMFPSKYSDRHLLDEVKFYAKHYKEVDDSGIWPDWKRDAYKYARTYEELKHLFQ